MADVKTANGKICDYGSLAGHGYAHGGESANSAGHGSADAISPYAKPEGANEQPEPTTQDSPEKHEYSQGAEKP